jgi:F420H(2)-dependent quinone reductase
MTGDYEPSALGWVREHVEQIVHTGTTDGITMNGRPTVLMTYQGAKTGKVRKTPVMRVEHEGHYAAVASQGGAPANPQWYASLVAEPLIELQDGTVTRQYRAREVFGDEKALWWHRAVNAFPDYVDYQRKARRQIPVFVLESAGALSPTACASCSHRPTPPARRQQCAINALPPVSPANMATIGRAPRSASMTDRTQGTALPPFEAEFALAWDTQGHTHYHLPDTDVNKVLVARYTTSAPLTRAILWDMEVRKAAHPRHLHPVHFASRQRPLLEPPRRRRRRGGPLLDAAALARPTPVRADPGTRLPQPPRAEDLLSSTWPS